MKTENLSEAEKRLSDAEKLVIDRYRKAKTLTEEFLAESHGNKAEAQFTAVVRALMGVIEGMNGVHRLERLVVPPKQARGNRYVN